MSPPEPGETVTIAAVRAPVVHQATGLYLWHDGEQAKVTWSHYWEGLLERGDIEIPEPPPPPKTRRKG